MTQEVIDVGVNADDGSGDSLYVSGNKINSNFSDFFDLVPVKADIKFFGNNITSRLSNADIDVHPSGTGSIVFPGIRFNDNNIEVLNTNDDIKISANGSGRVTIAGLAFGGTTISSDDSTSVNINENVIVDGDASFGGTLAFGSAKNFLTGSTFGTLILANGSITDSSGAISFGNENLTTTGTMAAGDDSVIGNLTLTDGSITDSSGAISFGNENLTTTGTLSGGTGSTLGNLTFANGSITDSSGAISFGNENLTTTGTMTVGTLTTANGSITDSSGAISFGNENLTTTGTLTAGTGSTLGNLTFANGSITDSGGSISFGNENLTTTATSFAINSTLTVANGSITDSSGAISFGNENVTTTGTIARATGSTIGNLTLANGSITDSSGAISFGNENLTTTATSIAINSTLTVANGSITDSSGAISFGNENVTTTGTIARATGSTIGNLTLANGSITDSSGAISFGNENLTTSASSMAINSTLTAGSGSITDSTGEFTFVNENLTTTGTLDVSGLSTFGSMTVSGATSFADSITVDNLTFNDNIISTSSNADLRLSPGGTGVVNVSNLTIDSSLNFKDNVLKVTTSNADLDLEGSGTGSVQINGIDLNSGTIDNVIVGANEPAAGAFDPLNFTTLVIPNKITFSGNTMSTNRSNDDIEFEANGTGNVIINGISFPNSDGQTGQFFQTNGSGVLGYLSTGFAMSETDIQDALTVITFRNQTVIDHVTAVGGHSRLQSSTAAQDQFATSKYDSAFYLAINRDDESDEFEIIKHSLAHNNSDAFVSSSGLAKTGTNNHVETTADVNSSKARLLGTGNSGANSMSYYRIGLGDDDSTGYSGEDEAATVINTDIDSASEVFDTWAHADFRGAKYYISVNNASKTEISNLEASVVHDGTAAYVSIYNVVNSGSNDLVTITAAIDGDNVKLSAAGLETNLRLHAYRIRLADDEADRSSTNVNVIGEVTVSSASTTLDTFSTNTYQGCHYIIVAHNSSEGASSICEASVVSDGTTAFITQYGMVSTKGTDQILLTAAHSSTTTTVSAISSSGGSTTVNAYRVNLARGEGSTTAVATLDSFSASTFRSANYFMQIADDSDGKYELQQVNITHDGTNAFISVFGSAGTDQDLITVTGDINGGNVRLRGTINTTNDHTVTVVRRIINV